MSCATTDREYLGYADYVERLRAQEPILATEFGSFRSVEHVLQWMQERGLTRPALDLVGQDEFSYDFLIQLGPEQKWLAFGVT